MFCPQCGAHNEDDAIYCGECGAVLDTEAMGPVRQYPVKDEVPGTPDLFEEQDDTVDVEAAPVSTPSVPAPPVPAPRISAPPAPARPLPAAPATSGLAIASLLLGIGGLTILPLLGGIAAIILGYMARSDIRQRPNEVEGDGLALAGIIMGWIVVGLAVLGLVFGIGLGICGLCAGLGSI